MSKETIEWLNRNVLTGFVAQRGTAWHHNFEIQTELGWAGLTNVFDGPVPLKRVKKLFDFKIEEADIFFENAKTGKMTDAPGKKVYYRPDNGAVMGIHGAGHQGHSYDEWLTGVLSNLVGDTLQVANAGLLEGGAVAWLQVEAPDNTMTPEGVEFRSSILARTSYNGKYATGYSRVITNVVCDNTLAAAVGEDGAVFKVKHTKNSSMKIAEARTALDIVVETGETFAATVAQLAQTDVTEAQWSRFLEAYNPIPTDKGRGQTVATVKREQMSELWNADPRVSPWKGTALGVLQAVNTWQTHMSIVRGSGGQDAVRAERNKAAWLKEKGGAAEKDAEAMTLLTKVLANA